MLILLQKGDNEVQQEIQSHRMNSPSEWPIHTIRNREVTKLGATLSLANIRNLSVIEFADFRNPLLGCRSPFCFAAQRLNLTGWTAVTVTRVIGFAGPMIQKDVVALDNRRACS